GVGGGGEGGGRGVDQRRRDARAGSQSRRGYGVGLHDSGKTVTPAGKVAIADEKSGTCHAAISPDGKLALVTRDGDDRISVLSIDGTKVEYTKRDISAGLRPYGIDIASNGAFAVVANIGRGGGGAAPGPAVE